MTWLESWEGSYNGDWYGSQEPEPEGSMRATLSGSGRITATLSQLSVAQEQDFGIGWGIKQKHIQNDDNQVIEIVLRCAVNVLSTEYLHMV